MNKMRKRFIALLVIFTSIISFLPVGFGGQEVNAATISESDTAIQVYIDGNTTPLTATTRTTDSETETIYSTTTYNPNGFDIALKDITTTEKALKDEATSKQKSVSGVIAEKVEIISVNGTSCNTTEGSAILAELGIIISKAENPNISTKIVGKKITGLPLGVNKIKYKVTMTTQDVVYTAAKTTIDSSGTTVYTPEKIEAQTAVENTYNSQNLTIHHGTKYVTNKIGKMLFKAYIGSPTYFDDDDEVLDDDVKENNAPPFLYSTAATPDSDMPLKYTFDVPDAITSLKYVMSFVDSNNIPTLNLDGATIYKNGQKITDYTINGSNLSGNLQVLGQTDLIVIKLNGNGNSDIEKSYAVEIDYNNLNSDEDYSLKSAGITKYQYSDDSTVEAYIGKKFDVTKANSSDNFLTYTGNIYIDKKAKMISLDPVLIRPKSTVAYVVTNKYYDATTKSTETKKSVLKDGKQFIDFMASTTSNQLQVDVYEGENGSKTSSSKHLARYLLNVNLLTTDNFALDLAFDDDNNSDTYLTQPGVSKDDDGEIEFNINRRTYDLYSSDPVKVSFALYNEENPDYTGIRSSKNEYLRVWLADSIDSNNLKEATASVNNSLDSNNTRSTSLNIDLNGAKKMVVQAYYDDFDENTTGAAAYVSHDVGDKYVFYLPENYGDSDTSTGNTSSDNALLNSLKVKGSTLEDSDGNEGFTSTTDDYTTTVEKDDTTAKITAIAQDDNIKSIVATIEGSDSTYDLVSGEESELPLDEDGKTTVNIVVTAQDGTTTKKYTVLIKNNTKSSNVNLTDVILNVGDYTFNSKKDTTKVHVSQNTTSIKVTPIPEDSSATITVDGKKYSSSAITVSLKGAQQTDIDIVVTSEDGTESKTYTLEVYRTDSDNWDDDDDDDEDDSSEDDQYYDDYYDCWVDTTKYEEWGKIGSKPAYFDKNNRQVKDAWICTNYKYYYLNSSGYRASGWKIDEENGKTYYLDPTTGEMRTGWMNLNNSWYYLGLNGVMQKGWLYLNKKWYYFTPNGQMVTSQSMYIDGEVCNFGQDGAKY